MTSTRLFNWGNHPELSEYNGKMVSVVRELPRSKDQEEPAFEVATSDGEIFQVGLSCLPDFKTDRIAEIVFDMTSCAMMEIRRRCRNDPDFEFEDSRELCWEIAEWAKEFENQYDSESDYLTDVEEFAYAKLAEYL